MDENSTKLTKKERRALRREERAETKSGANFMGSNKKIFIWSLVILALIAVIYFGFKMFGGKLQVSDIGQSFAIEGRDHVDDGQKVDYKTNPPTSGAHWATPSNWGVIDHEIPDEASVHNLEHGGIWLSYRPGVDSSAIEKLKTIAKNYGGKILLSPRSKNDNDIAVVSWGRIYKFNLASDGSFDENIVKQYISQYINTGPELVPDSMPGKNY